MNANSRYNFSDHFQVCAKYNRLVNERMFAVCAALPDDEYRKARFGSFSSIHRTLNHLLLGDRIWIERFESLEPTTTPALGTELYSELGDLRAAREREDARLEAFTATLQDSDLLRELHYTNNAGLYLADTLALGLTHLFNHQTHHRGQIHAMLSQTGLAMPSFDMHRIIHPV